MATSTRRSGRSRRPFAPEDLNEFISVATPRIAPDGDRIVLVRKHVGDKNDFVSNLWMVDCDEGDPRQFTSGGRDRAPEWSPDGRQIAFVGEREKARPQIHLIAADGGESTALTDLPEGQLSSLRWSPDGTLIAFSFREQAPEWTTAARKEREEAGLHDPPRVLDDWWYRLDGDGYFNAQRHRLYVADVATGKHRVVYKRDTMGWFSYDFAPDSRRLAITTNTDPKAMVRPWKEGIIILDLKTGKTKPVPNLPDGPKTAVRWSPNGKRLAYAGRLGTDSIYSVDNLELFVCDPAKGNPRSLTRREDYCLMAVAMTDTSEVVFGPSLQWSPDSRRVFMKIGHHGSSHVASVKAGGGPVEFHTSGAADFDMGNVSDDGSRMALTKSTPDKLGEVHLGELDGGAITTTALTAFNAPLLKARQVAKPTSHWVKTADGTKVHVWVMMPPGHTKGSRKKYPAVLEIHGGPHAQYGVGFFHEFQVLAASGYVVVYSNPRGSKGYGRDHCAAIRGSWGGADWVDIQAVTAFMQDHPNIDAKRMGVMGGSYGGYMTNWAIGHTNDFAGAITDRCVSNLVSMAGSSDFCDLPDSYFPGNAWDRPEARWEQSPLKYFGKARTPTLVIHSEGDLRCNVEQAEQVFTALKLLNVPTRFVRYPRSTSHGMSRSGPPDMRRHRLHEILGWWKRYLHR
jgi:acylaminoacyl-peptidase